jgi:tetratricopeptide (TPR) repeat protein
VDILLRIGQCNFTLGASAAAMHPYERVLQIDSLHATALNQLGQLYARAGDFDKAFAIFLRLARLDPRNSYYCKQAGSMATRAGNIAAAKFWFQKARELNPVDVEASVALGNILMTMELYGAVDSLVHQSLSVDPGFKPLLLLRARSAFEQQHYETVIITINSLLERTDTTALYARLLGVSYFYLHDYEKLIPCMAFLLKNMYDYEWIYYYMGVASRELGNVQVSITWFKMAIDKSISENTTIYYSQLGQSYEETGDHQQAIRAYRAAYNYSNDGILLYHLARNYDVYYKDRTTAAMYYQKYLESEDTTRLAKEYSRKRMQDMGHF